MKSITKFPADVITDLHPLFKGLLWVSVARSNDETRYALMHVHVEREGLTIHIVATDGKRMHVHSFDPGMLDGDIEPIEPGDYEVVIRSAKKIVITPATDDVNYPYWRQLLPSHPPYSREVVTAASVSGRIGIRSGVLLATHFAIEACGFGHGVGKDESVNIEFGSDRKDGPMLIRHELGKAIIMPMKMDEDAPAGTEPPLSDIEATGEIPGALGSLKKAMQPGDSMEISIGGVTVLKVGGEDESEHHAIDGSVEAVADSDTSMRLSVDYFWSRIQSVPHPLKRGGIIKQVAAEHGAAGLTYLEKLVTDGDSLSTTVRTGLLSRIDAARTVAEIAAAETAEHAAETGAKADEDIVYSADQDDDDLPTPTADDDAPQPSTEEDY